MIWIAMGFLLLLMGVALAFLMVLGLIEPSYVLAFCAHGAWFSGLLLGLWGVLNMRRP